MRELAASYARTCGLGVDGEVWCWSNWTGWWTPTPFRWGAPHRFKQLDLGPVGPICGVTTDDRRLYTGNPAAR